MDICNELAVFETKVQMRILGAVFDGDNWRRRYNDELMTMYRKLYIVSTIRLNR